MRYQGHLVEIIEPGTKRGLYRRCQVAIDGIPAIPFEVFEADFIAFPNDNLRNAFLARQGMSLIESYGDARYPKPITTRLDSHPA